MFIYSENKIKELLFPLKQKRENEIRKKSCLLYLFVLYNAMLIRVNDKYVFLNESIEKKKKTFSDFL